jgi:transcriptional regulator with XRE-family HTH domain
LEVKMYRLRKEREARGYSLLDLARFTGIHESDLSQLERGLRPAFPDWKKRLSRALKVPEEELFAEVSDED